SDFEAAKREVMALPVVKAAPASVASAAPPPPSGNLVEYSGGSYALKVPDNWNKYEDKGSLTFAPDGGISDRGGLAYGVIVSLTPVQADTSDDALRSATGALIKELARTNPGLIVTREPGPVELNGQPGLSTYLSN